MKLLFAILMLFAAQTSQAQKYIDEIVSTVKGDGQTDDGPEINQALKSGYTTVLLRPGKVYRSSQRINLQSGVTLNGSFSTLKPLTSLILTGTSSFIQAIGSSDYGVATTIDCKQGSNTFTVSSSTIADKIIPGKPFQIDGPFRVKYGTDQDYMHGWIGQIVSRNGLTFTVSDTCIGTFTGSFIKTYDVTTDAKLINTRIDMTGYAEGGGVRLERAANVSIERCKIFSTPVTGINRGIAMIGTVNCKALYDTIFHMEQKTMSMYAIAHEGRRTEIAYCYIRGVRSCASSGARNYRCDSWIHHNDFSNDKYETSEIGTGSVLDMHANTSGIVEYNTCRTVNPAGYGLLSATFRDENVVFRHNRMTYVNNSDGTGGGRVILLMESAKRVDINNNKFFFSGTGAGYRRAVDAEAGNPFPVEGIIADNYIGGGGVIRFGAKINNLTISGNYLDGAGERYPRIELLPAIIGTVKVLNNSLVNRSSANPDHGCIRTGSINSTKTIEIAFNKIYNTNINNKNYQIILGNNTVNTHDNKICRTGTLFVDDNSASPSLNPKVNNIVSAPCTVPPPDTTGNPPPPTNATANAGNDTVYFKNQRRPDTLRLDGSKSINATTYVWTMISGPRAVNIGSSSAAKAFVTGTFNDKEFFTFQLSINNNVHRDTVKISIRDWQKKNYITCRTGYDTTAKTGGKKFIVPATETKNSGLSKGWSIRYFNRDRWLHNNGYPNETLQGGDTLALPGADSVYLFVLGDMGGAKGCPVWIVPQTKPLILRGAGMLLGQDELRDTNVMQHVILDGTALRGSGHAFGFQINNKTPMRAPGANSFGGGWLADFTFRGFWFQRVSTFQIKMDGDSVRPWKAYDKFLQKNITLSDFIIDSSNGEAIYLGNTNHNGTKELNFYRPPQRMDSVHVERGIIIGSRWDGVQIASAREDALVQNVLVHNAGMSNHASQRTGIEIGGNTAGKVHRNIVLRATGNGIDNFGYGDHYVTQNIVDSVYSGAVDLSASSGIYQKSETSTTDYEVNDLGMKGINSNNIIARVFRASRYVKTANNAGDRVQRPGLITNNVFVNDSVSSASSLIENGTNSTVSGNTLMPRFPIRFNGYTVNDTSFTISITQGDTTHNLLKTVDEAVSWLFWRRTQPQGNAANTLPTANAGPVREIRLPTNSTTLSGSGSDKEGPVTYAWTKVSGPTGGSIVSQTSASTGITGLIQGNYVYKLTVKDNSNATAEDTTSIEVLPSIDLNQLPIADAGADTSIMLPVNSFTRVGTGRDDDGMITAYTWSQVSGPANATIAKGTDGAATFTFPSTGTWVFRLTVKDDDLATATDDFSVTVTQSAVNTAPTVAMTSPKEAANYPTGSNITVSADADDAQKNLATVKFYANGVHLNTQRLAPYTFTWTPTVTGNYNVFAVATDSLGLSTTTAGVNVAVGTHPTIRITAPASNDQVHAPVNITTSVSDVDGVSTIAKVEFYQVINSSNVLIGTDLTAPFSYSWSKGRGTYTIKATVQDNTGRRTTSAGITFKIR